MTRSDIDVIPLRRLNPSQHLELRKHAADGLVADGRGARLLVAEWKPSEEAVMPANQHVPDRSLEHLRVCARAASLLLAACDRARDRSGPDRCTEQCGLERVSVGDVGLARTAKPTKESPTHQAQLKRILPTDGRSAIAAANAQEEEHVLQCLGAAVTCNGNLPTHTRRQLSSSPFPWVSYVT
jgi:hypothetical protein